MTKQHLSGQHCNMFVSGTIYRVSFLGVGPQVKDGGSGSLVPHKCPSPTLPISSLHSKDVLTHLQHIRSSGKIPETISPNMYTSLLFNLFQVAPSQRCQQRFLKPYITASPLQIHLLSQNSTMPDTTYEYSLMPKKYHYTFFCNPQRTFTID
jgi:hypothetical protein